MIKKVKSKALTPAFSMLELIFVIVIIGILGSAITMAMPDNTLLTDKDFVIQKIRLAELNALNIDHSTVGDKSWRSKDYQTFYEKNTTCITLTKSYFNTLEENNKNTKKYKLSRSTLSASKNKICFDSIGRVYEDDYQLNNFLKMPIELNITYKGKTKELLIMPYSGAVISKR